MMEKYMTRIKSSQYQTDIAKHLRKNEKENERRQNFKIPLDSLLQSVDSESSSRKPNVSIPGNVERDSKPSSQRPLQDIEGADRYQDYVTQIKYVRRSNDQIQRTTLLYQQFRDNAISKDQLKMSKTEQNDDNLTTSITASIDFKDFFRESKKLDRKLEVESKGQSMKKPLPAIDGKRKSIRRKPNFCYPKDFRLPSLGSQDPTNLNHHESFTRRIDITIKSQPSLKEKRRLSAGPKRSEEVKIVKSKPKTKAVETFEHESNETRVTSSITTEGNDFQQGPVIKVSVTIGAKASSDDSMNTFAHKNTNISLPPEAIAVSPKLFEPFESDAPSNEFVRGKYGISTPPRPQMALIKTTEDSKLPVQLNPTVIPITTKEVKKTTDTTVVKLPADKNEPTVVGNNKVTYESKSIRVGDGQSNVQFENDLMTTEENFGKGSCEADNADTESPNVNPSDDEHKIPKGFNKMTQTDRLSNPSFSIQSNKDSFERNTTSDDLRSQTTITAAEDSSDIEQGDGLTEDERLVAGILETSAIKVHKNSLLDIPKLQNDRMSDSGLSRSPFSSESVLTPSMTSEILTAYQRDRLVCIWRNRSNMGDNNYSTGYTPYSDNEFKESKSPTRTPRSTKHSPRLAQCAVRQFPLRENLITAIAQDNEYASYKRHLGQVIRRDDYSDPVYGHDPLYPGLSIDEDTRCEGEDTTREDKNQHKKTEFVACVNVGSVDLRKLDDKPKPMVNLPKVRWKKAETLIKENQEKEKTKFPSIVNRVKQHKHGVKDCDCPDCITKKTKSTKKNKLPKVKGTDSDSDKADYSYESNKLKWLSELEQEKLYVFPGYIHPRLILISSKLHKIHDVRNIIREDTKGIIPIEYDFAKWTFTDLLDAVHKSLNNYHFGSRARSILFLCQGGPGYAYILRNFVATPQKLRRKDFKPLVHFFRKLGGYLSKLDHEDTAIHFLGFNMEDNKQGKDLVKTIKQNILPNQATVEAPYENTPEERAVASLYFNYKGYHEWKTGEEIEETPRSWSSLAARIE